MRALRKDGFGGLCEDEPKEEEEESAQRVGTAVASVFLLGLLGFIIDWFNLSLGQIPMAALALFLAFVFCGVLFSKTPQITVTLVVLAWLATAITQYIADGWDDVLTTHGLPIVAVAVIYWLVRGRRLTTAVQGIPWLFPVALIVIFIPLFSADVWQAANDLRDQDAGLILIVGALSITPVLLMLRSQLHNSVEAVFRARADALAGSREAPEQSTLQQLRPVIDKASAFLISQGPLLNDLRSSLRQPSPADYAPVAAALVGPSFKKQITLRLLPLVLAVVTIMALYIYTLAWAAIPISTSSGWVGSDISTETIHLLGVAITFPTGPYLGVAGLLGVIASAVFLAFVLTEERYSTALADALVHEPVQGCLALAIPYLWLREHEHDSSQLSLGSSASPA